MGEIIYFPTPASIVAYTDNNTIKQWADILESSRDALVDISCSNLSDDELDEVFKKAYNAYTAALNIFALLERDREALSEKVEYYKELSNILYGTIRSLASLYTNSVDQILDLGGTITQEEHQIYNKLISEVKNASEEDRTGRESGPIT